MRTLHGIVIGLMVSGVVSGCEVRAGAGGTGRSTAGTEPRRAAPASGDEQRRRRAPRSEAPRREAPRAEAPPAEATGAEPIRCAGKDDVELVDATIVNASGPAVEASGQCRVTLSGCTLQGSTFGVVASGNAQVTLEDCTVSGAEGAVRASGNAQVRTPGTDLDGAVDARGNASVGDAPAAGHPGKTKGPGRGKGPPGKAKGPGQGKRPPGRR